MDHTKSRIAEGILFTDQYQLTMAQLYFRMGLHERNSQFDHFFRSYPDYGEHKAGYCINAGLEWLLDWMQDLSFGKSEIAYLKSQRNSKGDRVFADDFLTWLEKSGNFNDISMRAIPEGRVVHANVPLTTVQGPLAMAQILETSLLNHLNYQILIATKASRIRQSGQKKLMLEFGMRRGPERGANAGTRAALIGGADFSSNVSASLLTGLAPKGTHAHSMVQVFMALGETELDAFRAYADIYPDDCLLLVDTINTLESGIPNAIKIFEQLKQNGHKPVGIRLDSGDLAHLAVQAAKMLNEAGFPDVSIVLSGSLDEIVLWQILSQIEEESPRYGLDADEVIARLVYGVGTRLITSKGQSALDGVYKLVAVEKNGDWQPALKISDSIAKIPNPGYKNAWRIYDQRGIANADLIALADEKFSSSNSITLHHPIEHGVSRTMEPDEISRIEPILIDILDHGRLVYKLPALEEIREVRDSDLELLDPGVRRIMNPHVYHVSLSMPLWELKQSLIKRWES